MNTRCFWMGIVSSAGLLEITNNFVASWATVEVCSMYSFYVTPRTITGIGMYSITKCCKQSLDPCTKWVSRGCSSQTRWRRGGVRLSVSKCPEIRVKLTTDQYHRWTSCSANRLCGVFVLFLCLGSWIWPGITNGHFPLYSDKYIFLRIVSLLVKCDRLCGLVVRVSGYRYRGLGFDPRRYQIFWVVVGSTQPREVNWGATWIKK
jgi:hypothetical protein